MSISNEHIEKLIKKYSGYADKIVNRHYYFLSPEVKCELCHVGLIGLWKAILAYYKRKTDVFNHKQFVNTIYTYMRYEMADTLRELNQIRISDNQWRNFVKAKHLLSTSPNTTEEQFKTIIANAGLRYDWYIKAREMINPTSLDMTIGKDTETDMYELLVYHDNEISRLENQSYINYIMESALYGIKRNRDKALIRTWLKSVNDGNELRPTELSKNYQLSPAMVSVIINRFINICRFVRDCEYEFLKNPNGLICLPEITEKSKTHNGKKIPGIKWVQANKKWKVEITIGKRKSVYIGLFKKYEDAVKARRDAEIRYRSFSNIEI